MNRGDWQPRGRGRGRGNNGRGRGRGGRGRGRGRGGYNAGPDDVESQIFRQLYDNGTNSPPQRGNGPGKRGLGSPPINGSYAGYPSPRGGKGHRGAQRGRSNPSGPLSNLLYEDRPFLRPIKFVPSEQARFLFQEEEEILKPVVEDVDDEEASHVPTADQVSRVFSGAFRPPPIDSQPISNSDLELEEIDFDDLSAFQQKVDEEAVTNPTPAKIIEEVIEERFTGIFVAPKESPIHVDEQVEIIEQETTSRLSPSVEASEPDVVATEHVVSAMEVTYDTAIQYTASTVHATLTPQTLQSTIEVEVVSETAPSEQLVEVVSETSPFEQLAEVVESQLPNEKSDAPLPTTIQPELVSPEPEPPSLSISSDDMVLDVEVPSISEDFHFKAEESPLFFVDLEPSPISLNHITSSATKPLGADDEDIIVYDAPLPRSRASTPHETNRLVFEPSPSVTKELEKRQKARAVGSFVTPHKTDSIILSPGPSTTKKTVLRRRHKLDQRRKRRAAGSFADRAADVAEAQLYEQNTRDPRVLERRQGDSDIDWGDSDADEVAEGVNGMEVDPELELDVEAMKRFAQGMSGEWKSMDDVADEVRMQQEDEDEEDDSSSDDSDDDNDVTQAIEQDEDDMLGESDDDYTPDSSFQARLQALRLGSREKGKGRADLHDEDSDEDDLKLDNSWSEEDDDFAYLQNMLLDAAGESRGERKRIFKAVQNGDFDEGEWMGPARRKKDKYKDLPPELRVQWAKDREKKAERKREREIAKLLQAADPLMQNKGGKKGRKAMLAAAGLDPTIVVIPNRVIDPATLVQQLRRFIADLNASSMSLPPTNKETRKNVHLLAIAFGLKSVSKGKGDARYTTLAKTTRTGVGRVDEKKVTQVMRTMSARGGAGADWTDWASSGRGKGKGKGTAQMPRHKEGDEVGKEAPKIGQSNIGFKMLASMGWSEGTHIGVAEERALKDPLTAVIKNTKLGLGATK